MTLEKTPRPESETQKPVPGPQVARRKTTEPSGKLEPSLAAQALTSHADLSDAAERSAVSYEVFLEQVAHDMAYEDTLKPEQLALLERFGYSAEPGVHGPLGFFMRAFTPSQSEYPHPILAFRGTEFTSPRDLQSDLEPRSVGYNQFRANARRIGAALESLNRAGRVWITGHSLGGALAQLSAAQYSALVGRVITFQSPGIDASSVQGLEAFNRAHPDEAVNSTHYQVSGDVVSSAGERLTPGEVVSFELKPGGGNRAKTMTTGILLGVLIGPGSGLSGAAAMEAISRHRAFPVSNAAEEHPAFQELFEQGKSFERIAGISRDTFEAKKPISTDIFNSSRISNFLRHNLGRGVFAAERAASDWGGDARAREWAVRNRDRIGNFTAPELLEHLERLLEGWVSDDDVIAFETICFGVKDPKVMTAIRNAIRPRLEDLHSDSQRRWIEDAINHQPNPGNGTIQRDALGGAAEPVMAPLRLGSGRPLETMQRERLEAHFNADLNSVRVHDGEEAAALAAQFAARAFTSGEDIVLGRGVTLSDELAAHEISHVLQQRSGLVSPGLDPDQHFEREARSAGEAFNQGSTPRNTGASAKARVSGQNLSATVQRLQQPEASPITWQDRLFAAHLSGTDGNRRLDLTLDRNGPRITGSFAVHGTGRGNITKGSFNSGNKTSPLHLECQFTDGTLSGQIRVLDGWFLYAEDGQRKDDNNDGQDDSSRAALPLLIGGVWKGGKREYKLEPISPRAQGPRGSGWTYNANSGNANFTEEVAVEVLWAANELGVNPNDLAACISFESAGSFSPSQPNKEGGTAIGLIQFLPPSLNQMKQYLAVANGKSAVAKMRAAEIQKYAWQANKLSRVALMDMSIREQMRYVVLHFKAHLLEPGSGLTTLYQKILAPFSKADSMYVQGTESYAKNKGLDADQDGIITADEAASAIKRNGHIKEYFTPEADGFTNAKKQEAQTNTPASVQTYTVTTMTSDKKVIVKSDQLSMQGAYPTALESIAFQPTRIVNSITASALADVRGVNVKKLERSAPQTGTEFLAVGADYGNLTSNGVYQVHTGWDLNVTGDERLNKPAFCAADGVVVFTGDVSGFRKIIVVYHPQLQRWTRYGHVSSYSVTEGQIIKAGEQVGVIGNAEGTQAPHLHFDIIKRLESAGMWNGVSRDNTKTKKDERDYNSDGRFDVNDRIEFVKDHYEDPQAFFARIGVSIPERK